MKTCAFCRIVARETPADIVLEDDDVLAFLSVAPLAEGHCLVIPKEHFPALSALPAEIIGRLFSAVSDLATAVMRGTNSDGYNIVVATGTCAGQAVQHLCIEVVPRSPVDGVKLPVTSSEYESVAKKNRVAKAIRDRLIR